MWPASSSILTTQSGTFAASHAPCAAGTRTSVSPYSTRTGTEMSRTSKPQGRRNARSSSTQPHTPFTRLLGSRFADDLTELGTRQLRLIRLAEIEIAENVGRVLGYAFRHGGVLALQLDAENVLARLRPAELLDVLGIHAGKPRIALEARRSERRDPDRARCADHPVWQERGAREHVWTTSRSAAHAEALESEAVGEQHHVFGLVRHCPPSPACRLTVSRPVVGHDTRAEFDEELLVRPAAEPDPGVPCRDMIGKPSGSPQTAKARTRPSGVVVVLRDSPTSRPYGVWRARSRDMR